MTTVSHRIYCIAGMPTSRYRKIFLIFILSSGNFSITQKHEGLTLLECSLVFKGATGERSIISSTVGCISEGMSTRNIVDDVSGFVDL